MQNFEMVTEVLEEKPKLEDIERNSLEDFRKMSRKRKQESESEEQDSSEDDVDESYLKYNRLLKNYKKLQSENQTLEKQNNFLISQLKTLREENLALRDNNVKFQVENFRLQQKVQVQSPSTSQMFNSTFSSDFNPVNVSEIMHQKVDYSPKQKEDEEEFEELEKPMPKPRPAVKRTRKPKVSGTQEVVDPETASNNKKIGEIMKKFDIRLSKKSLKLLADIRPGIKGDSLFVARAMTLLFDRETIERGTLTGNPSKNPNYTQYEDLEILDPERIKFLKKIFYKRVDLENLEEDENEERKKKVNHYINIKLQNCRRKPPRRSAGGAEEVEYVENDPYFA